jgi:hypothetical protein
LQTKLKAHFIGAYRKAYIIVSMPAGGGLQPAEIYSTLYNGNAVALYILINGSLLAFNCHIIRFTMDPAPLVFLSFPTKCQTVNIRKHRRVRCLFDAKAFTPEVLLDGFIADISVDGCSLLCRRSRELSLVAAGMTARLESPQLGTVSGQSVNVKIRCIQEADSSCRFGMQFADMPESLGQSIKDYIAKAHSFEIAC